MFYSFRLFKNAIVRLSTSPHEVLTWNGSLLTDMACQTLISRISVLLEGFETISANVCGEVNPTEMVWDE